MIMKAFNEKELKQFDGSDPATPVYIAYKGKVYDVTGNPLFMDGMHFEHYSGEDLTDFLGDAPHGEEVFEELAVVGEFKK
jgi:predicted heme/steroid binding protein